ncbi:hypothetical protein SODALDRAFT_120136 [Sodiomyces alkalinus F11]|uniref:Uncharacterized protein n=1 Tax=Sodiomyces alkalinus (strain CBS 110278 / VKM F-3762 / F11) TaxID=1314773 RepID=A0A3N2Q3X8_SODAK|nr:hypothetical protein SODALDRAFT_120136 [Sodiomyces alkalinus F11]ROT41463.1 hypothetical protein SODALDRAFT_120136 [Sodiomyces alkalinus F11]
MLVTISEIGFLREAKPVVHLRGTGAPVIPNVAVTSVWLLAFGLLLACFWPNKVASFPHTRFALRAGLPTIADRSEHPSRVSPSTRHPKIRHRLAKRGSVVFFSRASPDRRDICVFQCGDVFKMLHLTALSAKRPECSLSN